jgi:hypothetical protein
MIVCTHFSNISEILRKSSHDRSLRLAAAILEELASNG